MPTEKVRLKFSKRMPRHSTRWIMKKCTSFIIILFILAFFSHTQAQWVKISSTGGYGYPKSLLINSLGEITIAGYSQIIIDSITGVLLGGFWILEVASEESSYMRTSFDSRELDDFRYRYTTSDQAHAVLATVDGGYLVAGIQDKVRYYDVEKGAYISPFISMGNIFLLKLDSMGGIESHKAYSTKYTELTETLNDFRPTRDEGYIAVGSINSEQGKGDFLVVKFDAAGNIIWQQSFGGKEQESAHSVKQTEDGGYLIAGNTLSFGAESFDYWVIKLTVAGDLEWQKILGSENNDISYAMIATSDGGCIIGGETTAEETGDRDVFLIRLDSAGEIVWQRTYIGLHDEWVECIQPTRDGGFIAVGTAQDPTNKDVMVIKLNRDGYIEWHHLIGGNGQNGLTADEMAFFVHQTFEGEFMIAGRIDLVDPVSQNILLIKLTSSGELGNCDLLSTPVLNLFDTAIFSRDTDAVPKNTKLELLSPESEITSSASSQTQLQRLCPQKGYPIKRLPF
jgi:hypothetical protein